MFFNLIKLTLHTFLYLINVPKLRNNIINALTKYIMTLNYVFLYLIDVFFIIIGKFFLLISQ